MVATTLQSICVKRKATEAHISHKMTPPREGGLGWFAPVAQQVKSPPAVQETQETQVWSWVRKIWRRKWWPTPVFWSPWGRKEPTRLGNWARTSCAAKKVRHWEPSFSRKVTSKESLGQGPHFYTRSSKGSDVGQTDPGQTILSSTPGIIRKFLSCGHSENSYRLRAGTSCWSQALSLQWEDRLAHPQTSGVWHSEKTSGLSMVGSVISGSMLPLQGALVWSLVREVRSHMCGVAKKKKLQPRFLVLINVLILKFCVNVGVHCFLFFRESPKQYPALILTLYYQVSIYLLA